MPYIIINFILPDNHLEMRFQAKSHVTEIEELLILCLFLPYNFAKNLFSYIKSLIIIFQQFNYITCNIAGNHIPNSP